MSKRDFVMLAHKFNPKKHRLSGMFVSEKLDGMRCFWDGGVSRGLPTRQVPFANIDKDARYVEEIQATGLWTRYGKAIQAPDWWLNSLPKVPLDGELYMDFGKRQDLMSIVKKLEPGDDWSDVKFYVFDSPPIDSILRPGLINAGTLFKKEIGDCNQWWRERSDGHITRPVSSQFIDTYKWLQQFDSEIVVVHKQERLPMGGSAAEDRVNILLSEVLEREGEGLMLRDPSSLWLPQRSYSLLKVKPRHDSEARVIGYKWGVSGKEQRLLGKMGSLELEWENPLGQTVQFSISGFSYDERMMYMLGEEDGFHLAEQHGAGLPGMVVDIEKFTNPKFPVGAIVTFKYRTLTSEGKPDEAQFWRKYEG